MTFQRFLETIHSDDRERITHALQESSQRHRTCKLEVRCVWPDSTVRWIVATGRESPSGASEPRLMRGMAIDITERKQAEALAAESVDGFGVSRTPCQRRYLRRCRMARPTISISNGRYTRPSPE